MFGFLFSCVALVGRGIGITPNVPQLDAGPKRRPELRGLATRGCYATALSDSSERCIKDEIIQELGRALVLHGASTDYLSTVWSCGDTLPNEDVLGILADLNDKRLQRVKVSVEWATTLPQREQTAR